MTNVENAGPKQVGHRFKKGQSGNPKGKPKGARNATTIMAEKLLEGDAEAVVRAIVAAAKSGDMAAGRAILDRLLPPRRPGDRPIKFDMPAMVTAADAVTAMAAIATAVAGGVITPAEGESLGRLVESFRKVLETDQLERRCIEAEARVAAIGPERTPVDHAAALQVVMAGIARISERQQAAAGDGS